MSAICRATILLALPMIVACSAEKVANPYSGTANKILFLSSSPWGPSSSELEISRNGGEGSIFLEDVGFKETSSSRGQGKRATFISADADFTFFEERLEELEKRAFTNSFFRTDEFAKRARSGNLSMGMNCEVAATDHDTLLVVWTYPNKARRFAVYYAGCRNKFSKTLRDLYVRQERIENSIKAGSWFLSTSNLSVSQI